MFDANMRYISKGVKFIAEIRYIDPKPERYESFDYQGKAVGDVILCEMMEDEYQNPQVLLMLPQPRLLRAWENGYDDLSYAGKPTGNDFLEQHPHIKAKALIEVGGVWWDSINSKEHNLV